MKDFIEELKKQVGFLKTSCDLYDNGNEDEAIRIATTLRVLLHHTKKSKSLFSRLKIENLLSTVPDMLLAPGQSHVIGLIVMVSKLSPDNMDGFCVPNCNRHKFQSAAICMSEGNYQEKNVLIQKWWEEQVVFYWKEMMVSRKDLVLVATNQDGGAHVDDQIDPRYLILASGEHLKAQATLKNGKELECSFKNANLAALRQIAWEVLNSRDVVSLLA